MIDSNDTFLPPVVRISRSDVWVFIIGSVVFLSITAYCLTANPHEPLSSIADYLQIAAFLISFLPLLRRLWTT